MSAIYAVDHPTRQQFLRRWDPNLVRRRGNHPVDELRREPGMVEQEAPQVAVAFVHVVVAEAGKAAAVKAELRAGRDAALDATQEGEGAGRGAFVVDPGRELAVAEHLVELEADGNAPARSSQHDGANAGVL